SVSIQQLIEQMQADTLNSVQSMDMVQQQVQTGLRQAEQTGEAFNLILASVQDASERFRDATAISRQMATSTDEVAASAAEISSIAEDAVTRTSETFAITIEQHRLIESISDTVKSLSVMADELKQVAGKFKI